MRLVYKETQRPVSIGDIVETRDGDKYELVRANTPHKPSSSGKCIVRPLAHAGSHVVQEYYVGVFGMEWIEREDHGWKPGE
jgi:hypothetical protein